MQVKLAEMYTSCQTARAYLYASADMFDRGNTSNMNSAAVFLHCARVGVQVADEAVQVHGGNGYITEYEVNRLLRDAKLYEIGGGTKEIR